MRTKKRTLLQRVKRAFVELTQDGTGKALYPGVSSNRLNWDWIMSPTRIDDEVLANMVLLREASRQLCRSGAYGKGFLNLLSSNVLGPQGPRLASRVRLADDTLDVPVNKVIERGWKDWREDAVSLDETMDFQSFSYQQIRGLARDGEVFVRIWRGNDRNKYRLSLEALDPEWIDHTYNVEPRDGRAQVRLGIELDDVGRRTAYYVREGLNAKRVRIPAEEVIHVYLCERIGQRRGLPWFSNVLQPLRNLTGYTDAELIAARIGASKMGFFTNPDGTAPVDSTQYGDQPKTMEVAPGQFEIVPPGYGFESFNADHPNAGFGDFVKATLREIATGLGVSYNAYANDLEGVNYSSLRSGLLTEREVWRMLQGFWMSAYQKKVYRAWLQMASLSGAVTLPQRDWRIYQDHQWIPKGWLWVDPLKDVTATEKQIALGMTSRSYQMADQGMDFEEILQQLAEEKRLAEEYDVEIGGTQPAASAFGDPNAADGDPNAADDADPPTNGNGNGKGKPSRNGHNRVKGLVYGRLEGKR